MSEPVTPTAPIIRVFGGVAFDVRGELVRVGGPRQRRLLALLAIRSGDVVSIDWLAEYLWNDRDRPRAPDSALRTYISRLRQAFPEEARTWLVTEPAGYRLSPPESVLEHLRFGDLRHRARAARDRGDPAGAQALLNEALDLWRGDPFRELEDLDWAKAEIERLRLDRLEMFEERWETALALGRHTQITGELDAFLSEQPTRERAAHQYALALYRSGRTPEALRVIDAHRRLLADTSGLDPSAVILQLEEAILSGDPNLDLVAGGQPLHGYRLLEQVGAGSFAVVWRAIQPSVDRVVAVKQIRSDLASQPDFIRRFESEAQLVARVEHPHVVPLIDFWRDPDAAYLVMRWLPGGTLERRLDDGPMGVDETIRIAQQVGDALAAAHSRGVIHRDVKSANIMFDEAGNAFLTDFGIALAVAQSSGSEAALSVGSPAYASPEQLRREPLGPAADIFSLGVVLFESLTGRTPFADSQTADELVGRQLHEIAPSPAELRPDIPTSVAEAIARALLKDPDERFASVDEFVLALAAPTAGPVRVPTPAAQENPYVGLRSFDQPDAERFFGRRRLVSDLVGRLRSEDDRARALVVVGPSGSGKSSVVRAGLLPALRSNAVPGSAAWFITTMAPGSDPFEALEIALLRVAANPPTSLISQLTAGPRGVLRGIRRCLTDDKDVLLLVIDQLEELFIGRSSAVADRFLEALSVAVVDPSSPLRLVATLRADYYHRPLEHPTFARILDRGSVGVTPLAPDELEEAITRPAHRAGVTFEPGLVPRIAAETIGQPSPLPLLQHVLSELFERRAGDQLTVAAYEELGGVSGALSARAESIYLVSGELTRATMRRVFGALTDSTEDRPDLRRRVLVTELGDDPDVTWILDRFGEARLLTFDRDAASREPTVEVAHEALLREWPRLVQWLDEDRSILRALDRLSTSATTWDEAGRQPSDLLRGGRLAQALDLAIDAPDRLRPLDRAYLDASRQSSEREQRAERRRVRRLRQLNAAVSVALVIALVTGVVAVGERNNAESATAAAQNATRTAESSRNEAEQARTAAAAAQDEAELAALLSESVALRGVDPDAAILLALEARRRSPGPETNGAVLDALSTAPGRVSTVALPDMPSRTCAALDDPMVVSADGRTGFTSVNDRLVAIDLDSGVMSDHGPAPAACVEWIGDESQNVRWVQRPSAGIGLERSLTAIGSDFSNSGTQFWTGSWDGPLAEIEVPGARRMVPGSLVGRRILMGGRDFEVLVVDAMSAEVIGATSAALGLESVGSWRKQFDDPWSIDTPSGRAVLSRVGPGPDYLNWVGIVDTTTGAELGVVPLAQQPSSLAVSGGRVYIGDITGGLTILDSETGQVVSQVSTTATEPVLAVGPRDDGLVVVVSRDRVELVDPDSGPLGIQLHIEVGSAVVRPDGSVSVFDARQTTVSRVEMLALALVEKSLDVPDDAVIGLDVGRAAVLLVSGDIEVIDLRTGEEATIDPTASTRDLRLMAAFPTPDGLVGLGEHARLARWLGPSLVQEIDLASSDVGPTFAPFASVWDEGSTQEILVSVDSAFVPSHARNGAILVHRTFKWGVEARLVDWESGIHTRLVNDTNPDIISAVPSARGGIHVLNYTGLVRTYDADGRWVHETTTGLRDPYVVARGPGDVIAAGGVAGVAVIDTASDVVEHIAGVGAVAGLAFGDNERSLVIVETDGDVHLWDVRAGVMIGTAVVGIGPTRSTMPWFDEERHTVWVSSSGRLLEFSLDPDRWVERACEFVGRELSAAEWAEFVPGDSPRRSACS